MFHYNLYTQHNFKKIRNNILKSSLDATAPRCLTVNGKTILWEHFVNAYHFDQGEFSLSFNEKLTEEHFHLDPASKMRNHLAEEVLDRDMLALIKVYLYTMYVKIIMNLIYSHT